MFGRIGLFIYPSSMDATIYFEQNRPVHLARRDVYYEHAVEMLSRPHQPYECTSRVKEFEEILAVLRTCCRHACFAIRAHGKNEKDKEFHRFIELLIGNVKAILTMLGQKQSVEKAEGFFFSFLGINHASVALQAEEFERRANDIVRSTLKMLDLADESFRKLKEMNAAYASGEEAARYAKAREHFRKLVVVDRRDVGHDTAMNLFAPSK